MSTYQIQHLVGIKASPDAIYQALTDKMKLAEWWTTDTRGSGSKVGDVLEFWFEDFCQKFEVVELQTGKLVRWKANSKESLDAWAGTEIAFHLSNEEGQCWVDFAHLGWRKNSGRGPGTFPDCSTKWAVFLLSLKELLETGKGRPAPYDIPINHS